MRDKKWSGYVNYRSANPDNLWKGQEKWLYYKYEHQNWILPIAVLCFIIFFTNPPVLNVIYIAVLIGVVLFLCAVDNATLDKNPSIVKSRLWHIKYRNEHGLM